MDDKVSKRELEIIGRQLGRFPRGVKEIVRCCHKGYPLVIKTHPLLSDSELFPTLYYLTCPSLVREVSRLEEEGWIGRLQNLLLSDQKLRQEFFLLQKEYGQSLLQQLTKEEKQRLSQQRINLLKGGGVAGVRNWTIIKCLHAHYAHFLAAAKNHIGEKVEVLLRDTFKDTFPQEKCFKECG